LQKLTFPQGEGDLPNFAIDFGKKQAIEGQRDAWRLVQVEQKSHHR
jgi:hypothetical protein